MIKRLFQLVIAMILLAVFPQGIQAEEITPISKLLEQASDGDVIQLENHVYEEDIVIDKPVTLQGAEETVIKGSGTGDVVTLQADGITIENVRIINSGTVLDHDDAGIKILSDANTVKNTTIEKSLHGIYVEEADDNVFLDNTIVGNTDLNISRRGNGIHLFHSSGNTLEGNTIDEVRDGMYFSFAKHNLIERNSITNTRYGIHYMYSDYNEFYQNDFYENIGGAAIMYSDYIILKENRFYDHHDLQSFGVLFQTANHVEMENNDIHFNQKGIFMDQSYRNVIKHNRITNNRIGLDIWSSSTGNVFTENLLIDNNLQYTTNGGKDGNQWSEAGVGNAWSGHRFIDFNQDGISDQPYTYSSAFGKVLAEEEQLGALFLNSPALTLYETWNQLFQTAGGSIEDPAPIQASYSSNGRYVTFILPILTLFLLVATLKWRRKGAQ